MVWVEILGAAGVRGRSNRWKPLDAGSRYPCRFRVMTPEDGGDGRAAIRQLHEGTEVGLGGSRYGYYHRPTARARRHAQGGWVTAADLEAYRARPAIVVRGRYRYLDHIRPGDRPWSSQSPMIVTRDGELALVIGGARARRIISALVSVLTRIADEGLGLEEALAAPRLHVDPEGVTLERGVAHGDGPDAGGHSPDFAALTTALDLQGIAWTAQESGVFFARLNAVALDARTGERLGVADHRGRWHRRQGGSHSGRH